METIMGTGSFDNAVATIMETAPFERNDDADFATGTVRREVLAKVSRLCHVCGQMIDVGLSIFPLGYPAPNDWSHLACAKSHLKTEELVPPACKAWVRYGRCALGDTCFYLHPESSKGVEVGNQRTWGGRRRKLHKGCKASAL